MNQSPDHRAIRAATPDLPSDAVFSLIVCTLGRKDVLPRLLDSLVRQDLRDFEIILVDQNPAGFLDDIVAAYRSKLSIVHVAAAPGLSRSRNVGLAHARGRLIAFPDDDCWYEPDTLAAVTATFRAGPALAIVSGRTLDTQDRPSVSLFLDRPAEISRRNYLMCGNSNCIFFRREVFAEVGGFDVRLGVGAGTGLQSGEEADLILRALDGGLMARFFPNLTVRHDQVDDTITDAHLRRAANYGRGFGALLRKHRFPPHEVAYRVARPLVRAALSLATGRIALARYKWAWGCSIAEGYRRWPSIQRPQSFDTPG